MGRATRALLVGPEDLIARLCLAVPPSRFNLVRYYGVLCGHSSHRAEVVPEPPPKDDSGVPEPIAGDKLGFALDDNGHDGRPKRKRWGWLLRHVFLYDVDSCKKCGSPTRWLEVATTKNAIQKAMAEHGLAPSPARSPRPK